MAKYKYRKKRQFWHSLEDSSWSPCTEIRKKVINKTKGIAGLSWIPNGIESPPISPEKSCETSDFWRLHR